MQYQLHHQINNFSCRQHVNLWIRSVSPTRCSLPVKTTKKTGQRSCVRYQCGVLDSHCVANLALVVHAGVITQSRANPWFFAYFNSVILFEDFRPSAAPPTVKDRFSNSHRRLSQQRCSTNCQGQVLQFTPKTFAAALLHQLSRTGSPIHTEDFRSSAAPPTVKNRISHSHRRLSFQRCSTNCQGRDL